MLSEKDVRVATYIQDHGNNACGVYGLEVAEALNLSSGSIHSVVSRLERHDVIETRWHTEATWPSGREAEVLAIESPPRRRYYRPTSNARGILAQQRQPQETSSRWGWAGVRPETVS